MHSSSEFLKVMDTSSDPSGDSKGKTALAKYFVTYEISFEMYESYQEITLGPVVNWRPDAGD